MEKNKTIIILLSIVLTVIVFVVVCLWLFYPRNVAGATPVPTPVQYVQGAGSPNPADLAGSQSGNVAATGVATGANAATDGQNPPAGIINQNVLIVDGTGPANGSDYQIGPDGRLVRNPGPQNPGAANPSAQPSVGQAGVGKTPEGTTVTASSGSADVRTDQGLVVSAGSQRKPATAEVKVPSTAKNGETDNTTAKPSASAKPMASTKPAQAKTAAPKTAPAKASATKSGREFWIQVISSTSKDRVEQVRKDLAALGFNGRISAFSKDGVDFFRLRYGPYGERDEAKKFLDWVKMIKGLNGSFVTEELVGGPAAATKDAKPVAAKDTKATPPAKDAKPAPAGSPIPSASPSGAVSPAPAGSPAPAPAAGR